MLLANAKKCVYSKLGVKETYVLATKGVLGESCVCLWEAKELLLLPASPGSGYLSQ